MIQKHQNSNFKLQNSQQNLNLLSSNPIKSRNKNNCGFRHLKTCEKCTTEYIQNENSLKHRYKADSVGRKNFLCIYFIRIITLPNFLNLS